MWGNKQAILICFLKFSKKLNFKNLELLLNESWNKLMVLEHSLGARDHYHQTHCSPQAHTGTHTHAHIQQVFPNSIEKAQKNDRVDFFFFFPLVYFCGKHSYDDFRCFCFSRHSKTTLFKIPKTFD